MKARLIALRSDDRGQGAIEYIGVLLVVAALITVVVAAAGGVDVATGFQNLINAVFDG